VVTARKPAAVEDIRARFPDRAIAVALDVTDRGQIAAAIAAGHKAFGQIDVLCTMPATAIWRQSRRARRRDPRHVRGQFLGPAALIRAILPEMRARRSGYIIISPPRPG